ncbi:hypothetical protein BLX88_04680 [Bacillus obstructivus]|nr:hypothetical protein BLX88_04680 [Bacillus obstructivus]ONK21198.1 hypothetical protein BLX87_22995 [Bacillus sp. VT-16-64]
MDLKNFLESDQFPAYKEVVCVTNCLFAMRSAFFEGNYKQARTAAEHVVRSLKVLEEMQKKKKQKDKMQALITEMQAEGVSVVHFKWRGKWC